MSSYFSPQTPGIDVVSDLTTNEETWVQEGYAGVIKLVEVVAPGTDDDQGQIYIKASDSHLYYKDINGTETQLDSSASGANTALSNLASVAINTSLISDTNNTDDLGSTAVRWKKLWVVDGEFTNMPTVGGTSLSLTFQGLDAELTAIAGLTSAANKVPYFTGSGTADVADFTAYGRSVVAVADEAAFKALVNLEIGTDVQAYDAELAALAGLVSAANKVPMFSGSGTATLIDFKDEDNMASDSATAVPSQQSVKAYADTKLALSGGTITGGINIGENAGIIFDSALSADGKYSGFVRSGTAGATLAFGDVVYLAAADSRWELADASAASTSGDVLVGMCVQAAAADGDATTILMCGFVRADAVFPAMTISAPMYISETAGDITGTQPTTTDAVIRRVGFAWTADELYFCPSPDYMTHT